MKHYKLSVLTLALATAGLSSYGVVAQEAIKAATKDKKAVEEQIEVIRRDQAIRGSSAKSAIDSK